MLVDLLGGERPTAADPDTEVVGACRLRERIQDGNAGPLVSSVAGDHREAADQGRRGDLFGAVIAPGGPLF
jgi:hypothetical protein